jgi:DNA-binding XRE family transcriptional regulator
MKKWSEIKHYGMSPERIAELDAHVANDVAEMNLRALREAAGLTQAELAARADMLQPVVARLEGGRGAPQLATLRRYVRALGGEVEVTAIINGKRVPLAVGE